MANPPDKDLFTYEKERSIFRADLQRFHASRGTHMKRIPHIGGKEIDLYLLYQKVTKLGGWVKVTDDQRWEDIQDLFHIPYPCTNAAQALKQIYVRYLNLYEKLHHFGEDPDHRNEGDDGDHHHHHQPSGRNKGKNHPTCGVALTYNHQQHKLPDYVRESLELPPKPKGGLPFERLEQSLISGLPNEVDFVLNVCTLLSKEGRHTLQLGRCPTILKLLLAHVGVFQEGPGCLAGLHDEGWKKLTNRNFVRFWYESVPEKDIRGLILPDSSHEAQGGLPVASCSSSNTDEEADDIDICEVLNVGRDLGINDAEGQRVIQIAMIIRNLSFEENNLQLLSSNTDVLRFLMLCIHSKYHSLQQLGLDTLGNMALKMVLAPNDFWTTQLVLRTIVRCIASRDKFEIVSGMDMLARLCQVEPNEETISDNVGDDVYENIVMFLTVHDIQLIVYTLEVLYQLSELGEATCTHIAAVASAVDTLVSLLTVEAQSYGPSSLVGIKVVEHVQTAVSMPAESAKDTVPAAPTHTSKTPAKSHTQVAAAPQQLGSQHSQAQVVVQKTGIPNPQIHRVHTPGQPHILPKPSLAAASPVILPRPVMSATPPPSRPLLPKPQPCGIEMDPESLACNWLQAHYDWVGTEQGEDVPKMELYGEFLTSCGRNCIRNIPQIHSFANCVRVTFPRIDSIKLDRGDGTSDMLYSGLRRRQVPLSFPPNVETQGTTPVSIGRPVLPRVPTPHSPAPPGSPAHAASPGPPQRSPVMTPPLSVPSVQRSITHTSTASNHGHQMMPQKLQSPTMAPIQKGPSAASAMPPGTNPSQYPTIQQALLGSTQNKMTPQAHQQMTLASKNTDSNLIKTLLASKVSQNISKGHSLPGQQTRPLTSVAQSNHQLASVKTSSVPGQAPPVYSCAIPPKQASQQLASSTLLAQHLSSPRGSLKNNKEDKDSGHAKREQGSCKTVQKSVGSSQDEDLHLQLESDTDEGRNTPMDTVDNLVNGVLPFVKCVSQDEQSKGSKGVQSENLAQKGQHLGELYSEGKGLNKNLLPVLNGTLTHIGNGDRHSVYSKEGTNGMEKKPVKVATASSSNGNGAPRSHGGSGDTMQNGYTSPSPVAGESGDMEVVDRKEIRDQSNVDNDHEKSSDPTYNISAMQVDGMMDDQTDANDMPSTDSNVPIGDLNSNASVSQVTHVSSVPQAVNTPQAAGSVVVSGSSQQNYQPSHVISQYVPGQSPQAYPVGQVAPNQAIGQTFQSPSQQVVYVQGQQQMPGQGQQMPVQGQQIHVQGQQMPVQGQQMPVQGQQMPVQGQQMPVQGQQVHVQGQHMAVQGQQMLIQNQGQQMAMQGQQVMMQAPSQVSGLAQEAQGQIPVLSPQQAQIQMQGQLSQPTQQGPTSAIPTQPYANLPTMIQGQSVQTQIVSQQQSGIQGQVGMQPAAVAGQIQMQAQGVPAQGQHVQLQQSAVHSQPQQVSSQIMTQPQPEVQMHVQSVPAQGHIIPQQPQGSSQGGRFPVPVQQGQLVTISGQTYQIQSVQINGQIQSQLVPVPHQQVQALQAQIAQANAAQAAMSQPAAQPAVQQTMQPVVQPLTQQQQGQVQMQSLALQGQGMPVQATQAPTQGQQVQQVQQGQVQMQQSQASPVPIQLQSPAVGYNPQQLQRTVIPQPVGSHTVVQSIPGQPTQTIAVQNQAGTSVVQPAQAVNNVVMASVKPPQSGTTQPGQVRVQVMQQPGQPSAAPRQVVNFAPPQVFMVSQPQPTTTSPAMQWQVPPQAGSGVPALQQASAQATSTVVQQPPQTGSPVGQPPPGQAMYVQQGPQGQAIQFVVQTPQGQQMQAYHIAQHQVSTPSSSTPQPQVQYVAASTTPQPGQGQTQSTSQQGIMTHSHGGMPQMVQFSQQGTQLVVQQQQQGQQGGSHPGVHPVQVMYTPAGQQVAVVSQGQTITTQQQPQQVQQQQVVQAQPQQQTTASTTTTTSQPLVISTRVPTPSSTPSPLPTPPLTSPQSTKSQTSPGASRKRPPPSPVAPKSNKKKKVVLKKERKQSQDSNKSDTVKEPVEPPSLQFMCDWTGCKRCFESFKLFNSHVMRNHFDRNGGIQICQWDGCESIRRQRWSFLTHLQDRHINEPAARAASVKRQQKVNSTITAVAAPPSPAPPQLTTAVPPPAPPPPTTPAATTPAATAPAAAASTSASGSPVYPADAAIQAIRRFTARPPFAELQEMKEGPVTKHIRLTSALILRNLARFSDLGRSKLKRHEQHLAYVAQSAVESSTAVSHCLFELIRH